MWRSGSSRKGVWVDATIHAREWLATTTHLNIMQRVTHPFDDDDDDDDERMNVA